MSERLELRTLGGLGILRGGEPVSGFDSRKVPALLVYLACNPRPHPREVLAEMLWEDRSQAQSLSNLRVVLHSLNQTVGPFVEITRETVGIQPDSDVWLDITAFEGVLRGAGQDADALEEALALYGGDFLAGFTVDSQGFEDWALLERERLRLRAMEALDALIACHLSRGEHARGIAHATTLLHMDPLREKTHRQLMQLLALSGERGAALGQYETCCRMLAEEFGVGAAPETVALYQRIRAGELVPEPVAVAVPRAEPELAPQPLWRRPRHNLPAQATSFVGREPEIAAIIEQLESPDCRLLTLVGPGGMGKTRLALAVAERLVDAFEHGAFFVPLAPLTDPDGIASAIAGALQLVTGDPSRSLSQQSHVREDEAVLDYLREKEMLLVLDNFEHVLDGVGIVDCILAAAPGVTVLATSREPLALGWEWLYEVRGLRFPGDAETDQPEEYSAVRLFVERARRVQPGFRLADERAHVIRICQLAEGMPLGIEIAASWLRMMPCEAIAAELLDLESLQRDAPDRHASLRALFEQTWQRLPPPEQDALMKLSVFRGGFTRAAAEAVTQTTLARLAALVHKSLLYRDPVTGRYSMHELLRQHVGGHLEASGEMAAVCDRHCAYYAGWICHHRLQLYSGILRDVLADLANLRLAWDWGLARLRLADLRWLSRVLFMFYEMQGRRVEGYDLLAHAPEVLRAAESSVERDLVLGITLSARGWFGSVSGELERGEGVALIREGIAILEPLGWSLERVQAELFAFYGGTYEHEPEEVLRRLEDALAFCQAEGERQWSVYVQIALGRSAALKRDFAEAERRFRECLALGDVGGPYALVLSLFFLGDMLVVQGRWDEAGRLWNKALAICQAEGFRQGVADCLNSLTYVALRMNDPVEAEHYIQQALSLAHDFASRSTFRNFRDTLGDVKYAMGDFEQARQLFEQNLTEASGAGDSVGTSLAYSKLGFVALALGENPEQAWRHFRQSLAIAASARLYDLVLDALLGTACLYHRLGKRERALTLFGVPAAVSFADKHMHDEARLHAELETEFGPEAVAEAIARGRERDPLEVAQEVLAELERGA